MEQRHFQKKKKKKNAKFGQENPGKVSEFYYSRSLITLIVVPNPPSPRPIFQKLSHLEGGGGYKILLERGDKPEKGGLDVEMGRGVVTFFITLQFKHIYCVCWGE